MGMRQQDTTDNNAQKDPAIGLGRDFAHRRMVVGAEGFKDPRRHFFQFPGRPVRSGQPVQLPDQFDDGRRTLVHKRLPCEGTAFETGPGER